MALLDDWPAGIVNVDALLSAIAKENRTIVTASDQELLALVADALVDPWPDPPTPLSGESAQRRFARLVMLASDLLDERESVPGMEYIAEVLLPLLGVLPNASRTSREPRPIQRSGRSVGAVR